MTDQPPPARRGISAIALTLCAIGIVIAFSLFARPGPERFLPPADDGLTQVPFQLQYRLFDALGFAAYFLVAEWFLYAAALWLSPGWLRCLQRAIGALILLVSAAVVADQIGFLSDGPQAGKGGTIGAAGAVWLETNVPQLARLALLASALSIGMLLAAGWLVRGFAQLVAAVIRLLAIIVARLFLALALLLELMTGVLRFLSRRLEDRPATTVAASALPAPTDPVEAVVLEAAPAVESGNAAIPIHHHSEPNANTGPEPIPAPPPRSFPRVGPSPVEDPSPAPPRPYDLPPLDLLDAAVAVPIEKHEHKFFDLASQLEKACADFGLTVKVVGIHPGPVVTQYEISLDVGLRVSKITSLSDDLAVHLKVPSVRIVAPIPGKNTVGVEVPNENRATVRLKELVEAAPGKAAKMRLPLFLGKDSEGRPLIHDLADMPHLLIAGRTGTGKSVCLNSIILSLLLTRRPDECKLIMIDPKQVELAEYGKLPHLMNPVVTDNKKAEAILSWGVDKMEERYDILRRARVRNIGSYNDLSHDEILRRIAPESDEDKERIPAKMPYIVIVVDEVGDLMMAMKKEVEGHIIRLAQKSRAAGIHLILTTQRPTVDVITGLIKSNLPARICFQVADRSNSRVVLDEMGAEKLLGKGDMLFLQPNTSTIVRAQGTFANDDEIKRIVAQLEVDNPTYDSELMQLDERLTPGKSGLMEMIRKRDELYEEAIEIVIQQGRGSVSLLQRVLGIGYGRAARLIDYMAEDGIVGHYNGAQARDVLFNPTQWEEMKRGGTNSLAESA